MLRENNKKQKMPKKLNFAGVKELNKKYELDNVDDLWYFIKSQKNRWIIGSAH